MSREVQVRFCESRGVRFPPATHLVVCCHSRQQAEQVQARLARWLAPRGLAFNEAKTRIVHLSEGFGFLGFSLRRYPNGKLLIKPGEAAVKRFRKRLAKEFRALRGANVEAVLATIVPITRGWCAYYRTVVSTRVFAALTDYLWKLTYKWACWTHPNKPKRWIVCQYYRKFSKFRTDRWVFGNRDTGAYLPKPSWTGIVRHTLVKGGASPDDPALARYWADRRQKVKLPLNPHTNALLSRKPAHSRPAASVSRRLGTLVPAGHQEGDHGELPGRLQPARHHRTQEPDTPRTRDLPAAAVARRDSRKHRATTARHLNRRVYLTSGVSGGLGQ